MARKTITLQDSDFRSPPDYHIDMWAQICYQLGRRPDSTRFVEITFNDEDVEAD